MSPIHRSCVLSILLLTALLVACSGPTATPAPPAATPVPPTTAPVQPTPVPPTAAPAQPTPVPPTAAPEPSPPQGLRFDAPKYAINGPYAVGVRYFTIPATAENDRDLTVSVWYSAQKSDGATAEMVYEQQFAPGEIPAFSVFGHAQLDALPDDSGAPYPLVVYSHSHWSFGQETPYFAEHLASRGLVVISSDHEDNWSTAFGPIAPQAYFRRPQEITRQIDYAEHLSADGGLLPGLINTNQVGVAGWSQGAMTALAAAGARLNLANAAAWCKENPDTAELNPTACPDLVGREAELAAFAGLDETPAGLWPDWSDERVGAVVAMAPSTIPFGKEGMQPVNVPVMFLIGSGETSVDGGFEMASPYESVVSGSKAKVVFDYGEHLIFFSRCADSPSIVALGFPMFCTDPVWDMDRAHDLINHFTTAFLLAELKGDADAAKALAPENVTFPGIKYEAAGYGAAPTAKLDDATVAKLEGILNDQMQPNGVPGYAMCVVMDGNQVYSKGFGVAELGGDRLVTPQSVFAIASTTKSFTGVALMQLVEQGKVDLDKPVTAYLPYFEMADPRYKNITVRMLASHTSGLTDEAVTATLPESVEPTAVDAALEWYVRSLSDDKLTAAPGETWQYASVNFSILGDLIGKVSGLPYDQYVVQNILEPLKMTHSTFDAAAIPPDALVGEHTTGEDAIVKAKPVTHTKGIDLPAGGLYSTCEDMTRWMQVNLNRGELDSARILKPETYDILWKVEAPTGLDQFFGAWAGQYGLGWGVAEDGGHFLAGHPGGGAGQTTGFQLAPDDNLGVTVLANWGTDAIYPAWMAAADVTYALLGIDK
ncbi:MAG: serine hydrolase [Anaerolineae bacterium]|nr:serine hydrolase [Anaerolineae bacterium]